MHLTNKKTRREFIEALALGATGLAIAPAAMGAKMKTGKPDFADAEQWLKGIKGKHRLVIDGSDPNDALPLIWTWVYYTSNNQMEVADHEMTGVCVLRHGAIPFAFEDRLWAKYKLGENFNIKDNRTGAPSVRNPYYEPQQGDFPNPVIEGIKKMQSRGAMFCVCNMAITVYSGIVAAKLGLDAEEVRRNWLSGILPDIQVVPSGIWAVNRTQENGCSYIYAGG